MAITERYITTTGTDTYANSTNSATPCSLATAIANAAAGDRFNIKAGTYTRTATDTIANSGTLTSPIIWRGYNSTIGDLMSLGRTNGNGALITTNFPTIAYNSTFKLDVTGNFHIFQNLIVTASVNSNAISLNAHSLLWGCSVTNDMTGSVTVGVRMLDNRSAVFNNDVIMSGASGAQAGIYMLFSEFGSVIGNRIQGGPTHGIRAAASAGVIGFNTIFNHTLHGIWVSNIGSENTIFYNTICKPNAAASSATSDGINIVTGCTVSQLICGNHITDQVGYGINGVSAANSVYNMFNRFRDNGLGNTNLATDSIEATSWGNVTTDTGGVETDFADNTNADFNLTASAPAIGAGWPLHLDIGALQRDALMFIHPGMGGGARG